MSEIERGLNGVLVQLIDGRPVVSIHFRADYPDATKLERLAREIQRFLAGKSEVGCVY